MSADNGIYILKTIGPEWRVVEKQNIEDIYYNEEKDEFETVPVEKSCRKYWDNAPVFFTRDSTLGHAYLLEEQCYVCEYGITIIDVNFKW